MHPAAGQASANQPAKRRRFPPRKQENAIWTENYHQRDARCGSGTEQAHSGQQRAVLRQVRQAAEGISRQDEHRVAGERVAEQVAGINERSHGGFAVAAADADAHEAAFAVLQARQAAQQEQQRARQRRLDSTRQRQQRR